MATLPVAHVRLAHGRGSARRRDEIGAWSTLGLLVGVLALAAACLLALSGRAPATPTGGLLSAVPSDAAFSTSVRDALSNMHLYEPASEAADLPDPDGWADEFISRAVDPSLDQLGSATAPVHLRAPTESAVSALERVRTELQGYRICREKGGGCTTQRRGFDHAVDEAYRLLGDLALYTFG